MKFLIISLAVVIVNMTSLAATYYVATNGNDGAAGTNWNTAVLTISNGVSKASGGSEVWVSNGVYTITDQITIGNITLKGFNGASNTVINGNYPNTTNRCVGLSGASTILDGFTISNGWYSGGGVYIYNTGGTVRNCIIRDNPSVNFGGGIYISGGLGMTGLVDNCQIYNNTRANQGGGVYLYAGGVVSNCLIYGNNATNLSSAGGGVFIFQTGVVQQCTIFNNSGRTRGAGVFCWYGGMVVNCVITNNTANTYGGGGVFLRNGGIVRNCLLSRNSADNGAGVFFENAGGFIQNCTIVSNQAANAAGGGGIYSDVSSMAENTIIYYNKSSSNDINYYNTAASSYSNCCIFPALTNAGSINISTNNITNAPAFIDLAGGNYRLAKESPGINSGVNRAWMTGASDLDSHRRVDVFSGIVDIGCYEYVPSGTIYNFH